MRVPVPLCRAAYRTAYTLLRAYWYLFRPRVEGVKCVLTDGERVLLVRHAYGHREWDLPGGSVRRSEDPAHTARREMHEELGLAIERWRPLGQVRASLDHRRDNMHIFGAEAGGREIKLDRCELAAARWFPRRELPIDVRQLAGRILAETDGQ